MPGCTVGSLVPTNQSGTLEGVSTRRRAALCLLSVLFFCVFSVSVRAQTVTTFEGIDASQVAHPEADADANGAVGTKQFMEWTNVYFQAYDKVTFAPVWSVPQPGPTPFAANGLTNCSNLNPGDGVVIFDNLAKRWVLAGHSPAPNYYYCVAISSTDDLTSSSLKWYTYAFSLNSILGMNAQGTTYYPDWPKIGAWPDAYYVGMDMGDPGNGFLDIGTVACAFDRTNMLIGAAARTPQCFVNPSPVTGSPYLAHSLEPADVQGSTPPPVGSPEYFVSIQNPVIDGVTNTSDAINLWQFHVDWTTPANTTFIHTSIPVTPYIPGCYSTSSPGNTECVPESTTASTGQHIDSVGDRLMFRFSYRNFGEYQSYLASHTVQVGTTIRSQTGIRWYELRGNGAPAVYQSGTIRPDQTLYRFMPSIAQDQNGNAAVGYSVSSASTHPGISASWWSLTGQTAPTEIPLYSGAGDEQNAYFWGDYSDMTVDPVGGCAFWYINQYLSANQSGTATIWRTRVSNFTVPGCGTTTLAPSSSAFPSQMVGTSSSSQLLTLNNGQGVALSISSISFTGNNPGSFSQTNDCGSSLPAGGTCSIHVTFTPQVVGSLSATLNVNDNAGNTPQTVALSGTSAGGPVLLSMTSIAFGNVVTGTSKTAAVKMTNQTSAALTGINIVSSGAPFSQVNTCGTTLAAGAQCTITITFSPTIVGTQAGTITINDSATGSPQIISVRGTGALPVSLVPASLAFGQVTVGTSTAAKVTTVTNNEKVAVTFSSIILTGTDPGDYSQTNTCSGGLAAGAKCTISIIFTPTAKGGRPASVTFTDTATNSPQILSLIGTGK